MPPKKINKPRTKHANFPSMQFRLAGDDWLIAIWNPHNKQACYFLAEPSEYGVSKTSGKKEPLGYFVSSLERAGIARSVFPNLPRLFKTTDKAVDWLEEQVEQYSGDEFVSSLPANASIMTTVDDSQRLSGLASALAEKAGNDMRAIAAETEEPAPVKRGTKTKRSREELDGEIISEASSLAADIAMKMRAL